LNLFISDIQPFAGLLFIIAILPRIPSGAIDIKSLQDFKKHLITEKLKLSIWEFCRTPSMSNNQVLISFNY
ncbi:MAG: hypothetical protein Q8S54_12975, partial [Bacteroidota bacterium]|nr:hypothetical protein [Bacteroidota bacterium]